MQYAIKQMYHINAPRKKVYESIATLKGLSNWWTVDVKGDDKLNGSLQFNFGDFIGPAMKVTALEPNEKVSWECISDDHGWLGNTFTFALDENEGKTRIRFSHEGWKEQDDFYAACAFSWGRYLESLRQYCQTGKGEAFGSDSYRK